MKIIFSLEDFNSCVDCVLEEMPHVLGAVLEMSVGKDCLHCCISRLCCSHPSTGAVELQLFFDLSRLVST